MDDRASHDGPPPSGRLRDDAQTSRATTSRDAASGHAPYAMAIRPDASVRYAIVCMRRWVSFQPVRRVCHPSYHVGYPRVNVRRDDRCGPVVDQSWTCGRVGSSRPVWSGSSFIVDRVVVVRPCVVVRRRRVVRRWMTRVGWICGAEHIWIYIPRRYVYTWPPGRRGGAAGRVPSSPSASSCVKSFTTTTHIRQYTIL